MRYADCMEQNEPLHPTASLAISKREQVLTEAIRVVTQDRNLTYGGPERTFERIAAFWSVLFGWDVTPVQVALAMDLMKTARLMANPTHTDSWVDKAGYAACGAEVADEHESGLVAYARP
jgi:Domain of unknown function (DUF6378)